MKRWLKLWWLRWQRQSALDDRDQILGVMDVGRRQLDALQREANRLETEVGRIDRQILMVERPRALTPAGLRETT